MSASLVGSEMCIRDRSGGGPPCVGQAAVAKAPFMGDRWCADPRRWLPEARRGPSQARPLDFGH
eukprot:67397-Alexandrium_andersonii.AAC.1